MNEITRQVLDVVIAGLKDQSYTGKISDQHAFYVQTVENGFSGIVYKALNSAPIWDQLKKHFERDFFGYVTRDAKQLDSIETLDHMLNESMINHIFLKGSRLKAIYPESFMRAMGDIDVLIPSEKMNDVHHLFKKKQILLKSRSTAHDVFELPNHIIVEVHPSLYKDFNPKYESLMKSPWSHVNLVHESRYELKHEYELVYLLYHLAKHLDASGIGLRSVLDIGLYAKHYESSMNIKTLHEYVNQVDMKQFFQSMMVLCQVYFDLDLNRFIDQDFRLEDEVIDGITEYLRTSGIHGTGKKHNAFTTRFASSKNKKKNRIGVILGIFFPDFESMCGIYPWLKKAPLLLPVTWLLRVIRLIFVKFKSSVRKVKSMTMKEDEIDQLSELFTKIGL